MNALTSNPSVRRSNCCYHMHQSGWNEVDAKQWARVCVTGLDDLIAAGKGNTVSGGNVMLMVIGLLYVVFQMYSIEDISNAFMKKYLITPIVADDM